MKRQKTVLVTGASSGIGKAFAMEWAARKMDLILVARSKDALDSLADIIRQEYSVSVEVIAIDLSAETAAQDLFDETKKRGLSIDILVNNAAFGKWGEFHDFDLNTYKQMLRLNINTLTDLCYLFLPEMKSKQDGGIVNVASSAALMPVPYAGVYSASKSYVLNFSEALHGELIDKGVVVTCLCPSGTKSNFANVANSKVKLDESKYETPEFVAKNGVEGFLKKQSYVLSGKQKTIISLLPRLVSRSRLLKISGDIFKKLLAQ